MKMFYVYKKNYCEYSENRGMIVISDTWQRAKGIAMAKWDDQPKNNIEVEDIKQIKEGILCNTDWILNEEKYN